MANTTSNYNVNYEDKRFAEVESAKQGALADVENTYGGMINSADNYYNSLIDESKAWAEEQKKQQQAQTDFTLDKIEQQKEQANKEYTREQSGAYVDWQKQSNAYGVNAEQMAAAGMQNSGFSESAQVSMYNTYQNRVSTARESFLLATQNYDNNIKEAQLQNSVALAQIARDSYKQQLELALEGFQYKNNLVIERANKRLEVENTYYNRYKDVLAQINHENEMREQARQFGLDYDLKLKEYNEGIRQFNEEIARLKAKDAQDNAFAIQELEHKKAQLEEQKRQFNEEIARLKANDAQDNAFSAQELEHKKAQLEEQKRQFNEEIARLKENDAQDNALSIRELEYKRAQLEEQKRQFDAKQAANSTPDGSSAIIKPEIAPIVGGGSTEEAKPENNNPKIDQNSWNSVQKSLGVPITQADMARLVANGTVTMRIENGTAYFVLTPNNKKPGLVGNDRGYLDLR